MQFVCGTYTDCHILTGSSQEFWNQNISIAIKKCWRMSLIEVDVFHGMEHCNWSNPWPWRLFSSSIIFLWYWNSATWRNLVWSFTVLSFNNLQWLLIVLTFQIWCMLKKSNTTAYVPNHRCHIPCIIRSQVVAALSN